MSHSSLKDLNPENQLKNITFLKETSEQLNKDLTGFTKLKIQLTSELLEEPLEELKQQLTPIIEDLEASNNLQSFIYKVDLKEEEFLNYCAKITSTAIFFQEIIERSAQKVYLRWYFSNRLEH